MAPSSSSDAAVIDASFQAETFDALAVNVPEAHVRIRPQDENDAVHVRGFVPDLPPDAARSLFDRRDISTHQSKDRLHILGNSLSANVQAWRWRRAHRTAVHFEIALPSAMDVTAQTPGGAVEAAHLTGTVDLTVQGGSVRAHGLAGPVSIRGSGAGLSAQHCSGASLNLRWASGEVTLRDISADQTTLRAASAPATVDSLHGPAQLSVHGAPLSLRDVQGPCEATVQGAALTFHGAPTAETTLQATSGPVHTHLPSSHAASLTLAGAHVELDERFGFEGERTAHRIEGALNGGGPSLQLRAIQGRAHCRAQTDA